MCWRAICTEQAARAREKLLTKELERRLAVLFGADSEKETELIALAQKVRFVRIRDADEIVGIMLSMDRNTTARTRIASSSKYDCTDTSILPMILSMWFVGETVENVLRRKQGVVRVSAKERRTHSFWKMFSAETLAKSANVPSLHTNTRKEQRPIQHLSSCISWP